MKYYADPNDYNHIFTIKEMMTWKPLSRHFPDATYRNKAGKQYRGYSANIEETVGKNGSVVTDYQYDKNIHTDSQFLQESLSAMKKSFLLQMTVMIDRTTLRLQKMSAW